MLITEASAFKIFSTIICVFVCVGRHGAHAGYTHVYACVYVSMGYMGDTHVGMCVCMCGNGAHRGYACVFVT